MVAIKSKLGDCWNYELCVILDRNLLDEDVNMMCLHVIENLVKGIIF